LVRQAACPISAVGDFHYLGAKTRRRRRSKLAGPYMIHGTLDKFEAVDVSFDRAVGPFVLRAAPTPYADG